MFAVRFGLDWIRRGLSVCLSELNSRVDGKMTHACRLNDGHSHFELHRNWRSSKYLFARLGSSQCDVSTVATNLPPTATIAETTTQIPSSKFSKAPI